MTPKELVKLITKNGYRFDRHGANHDLYINDKGQQITVERRSKDIATGTLNKILKDAGLK